MNNISIIIGAGNFGLSLAAYLKKEGDTVYLWGRSIHKSSLYKNKKIYVSGQDNGVYEIDIVSNDLDAIFDKKKNLSIYLTVPANVQEEVVELFVKKLKNNDTIYLMPGRTLGLYNLSKTIKNETAVFVNLYETQTVFLTCRKIDDDKVVIYKKKDNVLISCTKEELKVMPPWFKNFFIPASTLEISLANMGMLLHPIPTLLNSAWIENKTTNFKYYRDGISKRIAKFIENVDRERVLIASQLNVKTISLKEWIEQTYNSYGDTLYSVIQNNIDYLEIDAPLTLEHRYIYEDILTGLVPLESIAKVLNTPVKHISIVIDLANILLEYDFRENGRKIVSLEELEKIKNG